MIVTAAVRLRPRLRHNATLRYDTTRHYTHLGMIPREMNTRIRSPGESFAIFTSTSASPGGYGVKAYWDGVSVMRMMIRYPNKAAPSRVCIEHELRRILVVHSA